MRGLLKAALLFAPALAAALTLPPVEVSDDEVAEVEVTDVEGNAIAVHAIPSVVANYYPADLNDDFSIEDEIDELVWMKAQLKELEYLIWEKEQAIDEYDLSYTEEEIGDCDSLTCIVKTVVSKARNAAHKVFGEVHGDDVEEFGGFPKSPFKKPHWKPHWPKIPSKPGRGKHSKPGNHTCGPPKHGNHTHPPHFKKPHFPHHRPLPICRYPPPHHGPPHHKPPPHKPPPHKPPHDKPPHHEPPPPSEGPPQPPHDGEFSPEHDEMPSLGPGHRRPGPIPSHPGKEPESPFLNHEEHGPPGPPRHQAPFDRFHNSRHRGRHVFKFVVTGIIVAFIVVALHRRTCNPKRRAARLARREERRRRRAMRRAIFKQAIANFFARVSGHGSDESDDYEEKRQALLASAEDGMSVTMTEEITQFRNAADVVEDMVAAEAGRVQTQFQAQPILIPASERSPSMRDYDIGSQAGEGEDLPAYEDNDGSEMSSVVADGFRYTPGSSEYSPSRSPAGSVSDILGPDTKQ